MKIKYFKIENFRNIKLAECENPPDFMVICGGNGCGKSAFLNALMAAKENAAPYGGFTMDPRCVSADADMAKVILKLEFNDVEKTWYQEHFSQECPVEDEIHLEISKGGSARTTKQSRITKNLLGYYSRQYTNSPGFFDYIDAHRVHQKKQLSTWNSQSLSDNYAKQTLGATGSTKFQYTKEYLASLVFGDLQVIQKSHRDGHTIIPDSLKEIRDFFNSFFAPMQLVDVRIDESPFKYIINAPRGEIDLDDMSSGEKEVLNTYIRFHQLKPSGAVILFDEADAHLHPDLERRYLEVLRSIGSGNQLWLTTHSPEMMIAAGAESLYTILKEPLSDEGNQFVRVTNDESLHEVLSEVMGSRGLVSFNQRIIFLEGDESSIDRELYEKFYPPGQYNVSFVPAGNSATVRKTAEQVNHLLSNPLGYQEYYSIVDGDIERAEDTTVMNRLFKLPVYHIENCLIIPELILQVTKEMLGSSCPYNNSAEVENELKSLALQDGHFKPFTKALYDAKIAKIAKHAYDSIYKGSMPQLSVPTFKDIEAEARQILGEYIKNSQWIEKCKGRELLKAFCGKNCFKYQHFRNCLIAKLQAPPKPLIDIMNIILNKR